MTNLTTSNFTNFKLLKKRLKTTAMIHHFFESQKVEIRHFKVADKFYRQQFGATKTARCDYRTEKGRAFQQEDIDLWLTLKNKKVSVSEKKRTRDFNDLYLEIYSKFPVTSGWALHSKADFLAYFFPKRVFWAGFPQIIRFCRESLSPQIASSWFEELKTSHLRKNMQEKHTVRIAGKPYDIFLIQAYNESNGNSWYTMGVSIPFDMLKDNHIRFRLYPLKE